jgi:hypothetical protein
MLLLPAGLTFCPWSLMCAALCVLYPKSGGVPLVITMCLLLFVLPMKRFSFACNLLCFGLVILTLLLLFVGFAKGDGNYQGCARRSYLQRLLKKLLMRRLPRSQTENGVPHAIPALPVMSLARPQGMLIERREWRCEIGCVCHWVMYHTAQKNVSLVCLLLLIFI